MRKLELALTYFPNIATLFSAWSVKKIFMTGIFKINVPEACYFLRTNLAPVIPEDEEIIVTHLAISIKINDTS
jgi:hypothetical protein